MIGDQHFNKTMYHCKLVKLCKVYFKVLQTFIVVNLTGQGYYFMFGSDCDRFYSETVQY